MALTSSNMPELGFHAPEFNLPEPISGRPLSLKDVRGKNGTLIIFSCNHCPFVLHIEDRLLEKAKEWMDKGVGIAAISANDIGTHPQDGPDKMAERVKKKRYPFPYLYDESQQVAKAYQAACTPDFFLFDRNLHCLYRGQFDDARPGNSIPVSGSSLDAAITHLLETGKSLPNQKASMGCNIKWRSE